MDHFALALVDFGLTPYPLSIVPVGEWYSKLQAAAEYADETVLARVPAIKLANFFEAMSTADRVVRAAEDPTAEAGGLSKLSTQKAQAASHFLRALPQLGADDVRRWVGYWVQKGFLA
jgi:hypothetical protein